MLAAPFPHPHFSTHSSPASVPSFPLTALPMVKEIHRTKSKFQMASQQQAVLATLSLASMIPHLLSSYLSGHLVKSPVQVHPSLIGHCLCASKLGPTSSSNLDPALSRLAGLKPGCTLVLPGGLLKAQCPINSIRTWTVAYKTLLGLAPDHLSPSFSVFRHTSNSMNTTCCARFGRT